jgi:hypothetical protein
MRLKRVYHPVWEWEEIAHNMWGEIEDRAAWVQRAIEFTGDHKQYGHYMRRVTREWPISCENALTDYRINRKAWIGHAACALAMRCPEDVVREAWGHLTDEQRLLANGEAERSIACWEVNYRAGHPVYRDMGDAVLFGWDTGRLPEEIACD